MGECFRRRRAERKPDPPAEAPLSWSNRLAGIVRLKKLLGSEPTAIGGNSPKPCVVSAVLIEPGQQLDKAKLANGCGTEPQDNLVVLGVMREGSVTLVELRCAFPRPEARAHPAQPAQCQATRNWSSVESIAPRQDVSLLSEPRLAERTSCRFAVNNVERLNRHAQRIQCLRSIRKASCFH